MSHAFFVGTGFIGGTVLRELRKVENKNAFGIDTISALSRSGERSSELINMGVKPIAGTLDAHDVISAEAERSDIIVHAATADDKPSVEAILAGIRKRAAAGKKTVYLHTSGTGVLDDHANGNKASSKVYRDDQPDDIEGLPDSAPHRNVDLIISRAAYQLHSKDQRIAIILPPTIYGEGTGPANTRSIQIPALIEAAMREGNVAGVGQGKNIWSTVEVNDLADGYLLILRYLIDAKTPFEQGWHPYFFATPATDKKGAAPDAPGEFEFAWSELYEKLAVRLYRKRLISNTEVDYDQAQSISDSTGYPVSAVNGVFGSNSRSRAIRLHQLGWKPKAGKGRPLIFDTLDGDIEAIIGKSGDLV